MSRAVCRALALILTGLITLHASAQTRDEAADYPNKPVRFIVAFAPGAGTDLLGRLVAAQLSRTMGQPFVVENKTGASGIIATQAVLAAAPDGYTVLVGGSAPMVFNPIVYAKLPYDPADLVPVTILGSYPLVIAAKNDLPVKNLKEMIQLAKENPGRLTYGHVGPTFQTQMEYLNILAGIKMTDVPYKGGGPTVQALLAGDIDLAVSDMASIAPLHKAGKLRAIAVTTSQRNPILPDVPTVAESGEPGYDGGAFAALGVHRQTPAAIVRKLQQEVAKVLATAEVRDRFIQLGIKPGGMSPADTMARIKYEIDLYKPIAAAAGIRASQ